MILKSYRDIWGKQHDTPAETIEILEGAMASGDAGPPVWIVEALRPAALMFEEEWRVECEDGSVLTGRSGRLPPLPAGYHRLLIKGAETFVIAAPRTAWLPDAMERGRVWGLAVQLYGLRSARNWGVGDFTDLAEMARLAGSLGADALGFNPVHAAFPSDPTRISPYSPSNRQFLNPLYLDLTAIEGFARQPVVRHMATPEFQAQLRAAREAELVDWDAVAALKWPVLELIFETGIDETGLNAFRAAKGEALERHALFEALAEQFGTWWGDWPEAYCDPASAEAHAFAAEQVDRVRFFAWCQWQADRQLAAAQQAAREAGMAVGLYRDLAVGSDMAGAEVWVAPDAFLRVAAAGAPPDLLNRAGQDWGLPPLNPGALAAQRFEPFIHLVRANMAHAGALRIDHVLGLRRIFAIPRGQPAAAGAYIEYPFEALIAILRLESHRQRCLVIGEDLGTVPPGFSETMTRSGILSYRLLWFERDETGFKPPENYPAMALVAASTHDLPTIAGWWHGTDLEWRARLGLTAEEDRPADRKSLGAALGTDDPTVAEIYSYLARSPAKLLMVQIEDVLELRDQANLPGTLDEHPNWRRRLPVDLTEIAPRLEAIAAPLVQERPRLADPGLRATYRVQFHKGFTFDDAVRQMPYWRQLGISHVYASPILQARPGSTHGYDIVDHGAFNPELGGAEGFERFSEAVSANGLKLLLDIVPNHMGVGGSDNSWWLDVLEWGPTSPQARTFDIAWSNGKLLLPYLGSPYGDELEAGKLELRYEASTGRFDLWYYHNRMPIRPADYGDLLERTRDPRFEPLVGRFRALARIDNAHEEAESLRAELAALPKEPVERVLADLNGTAGDRASFQALHELLERQHWRAASWRVAADEINYRRFFDVNDLAGVRVEDPVVFDAVHALTLRLVHEGRLQGLRIDHIDGLADPEGYCRRLRDAVGQTPIYVEKILASHEKLRDWPIQGTTGYDFLNQLNSLFVDAGGLAMLDSFAERLTGRSNFEALLVGAKLQILDTSLTSEIRVLSWVLKELADSDWTTRDYTVMALRQVLRETIAWFPVYRTYVVDQASAEDRRYIDWAIARATKRSDFAPELFEFLRSALTLDLLNDGHSYDAVRARDFVRRFQQLTGPVMAKGMEDTSFYRWNRLISVNEVGGDPPGAGVSAAGFQLLMQQRARDWPQAMLATATHDTKRGEDARARLNLLSDMPGEWAHQVVRWTRLNRAKRRLLADGPAPSRNDELLIYQTLFATWPLDESEIPKYQERLSAYFTKALREAKERTSWANPNEEYEQAVLGFVEQILDPDRSRGFMTEFLAFHHPLAELGAVNSLSQTLLKLTLPGVPDIYQGTEFWDLSLVDPDNRRPVDYAQRLSALKRLDGDLPDAWRDWPDGRVKLGLIAKVLEHRSEQPLLYESGDYVPLTVTGGRAEQLFAFMRRRGETVAVCAVPLMIGKLGRNPDWGDTSIQLGAPIALTDRLSRAELDPTDSLSVGPLLAQLPVAFLAG